MVEPVGDLAAGQGPDPRRDEFERQRDPGRLPTDPHHGIGDVSIEGERRVSGARTVLEQPDGVVLGQLRHPDDAGGRWQGQRRQPPGALSVCTDRFTAGRHHAHVRAAGQHRPEHGGHTPPDVFAVVHDEEHLATGQCLPERTERLLADVHQAHRLRQQGRHLICIRHRGEPDEENIDAPAMRSPPGELDRQSGLAAAARTDDADEPVVVEQRVEVDQLLLPADEAGQRPGPVRRRSPRGCRRSRRQRTGHRRGSGKARIPAQDPPVEVEQRR